MADIVNLRAARKRKARAGKREKAAANRLLHGRDGAETQVAKLVEARTTRVHEGHRLESGGETRDGEDV